MTPKLPKPTTKNHSVGRQTKVTDADGHTMTSVYDVAGNVVAAVDGLGRATAFVFDELGRVEWDE